ncbi:hypothetical protein D1165_10125 [Muribaculaceae bacterium M3]|nr:hypothetical protein [Muribaculaceae bacterium M3]
MSNFCKITAAVVLDRDHTRHEVADACDEERRTVGKVIIAFGLRSARSCENSKNPKKISLFRPNMRKLTK